MAFNREFLQSFLNNQLQGITFLLGLILIFLLFSRLFHKHWKLEHEALRWKWLLGGIVLIFCSFAITNTLLGGSTGGEYALKIPDDMPSLDYTGFTGVTLLVSSGFFYCLSAVFPKIVYPARFFGLLGILWPLFQVLRLAVNQTAPGVFYIDLMAYFLGFSLFIYTLILASFCLQRWRVHRKRASELSSARTQLYYASASTVAMLITLGLAMCAPEAFTIYLPLFVWAQLSFASALFEWLRPISMMNALQLRPKK